MSEETVAYHEAGHAVAFYVQGFAVRYIDIIPRPDGSAGRTESIVDAEEEQKDFPGFLKRYLVCQLSGMVAKGKFLGLPLWPDDFTDPQQSEYVLTVGGKDITYANQTLAYLAEEGYGIEECKQEGLRQADELVQKHWEAIKTLARVLLKETALNRGTLELILLPFGIVK